MRNSSSLVDRHGGRSSLSMLDGMPERGPGAFGGVRISVAVRSAPAEGIAVTT